MVLCFGVERLGLGGASGDVQALVANANVTLSDEAWGDLLGGIADPPVVRVLAAAGATHRNRRERVKTGHSQYVAGTDRMSNHYYGRAVDVYAVDGTNVSVGNDAALDLALALLTSGPGIRPEEYGSPWPELARFPGTFSDEGPLGHLHTGRRSAP